MVLAASCIISLCIGSGFAWNVNQTGFVEESAAVFGRAILVTPIAMTFTIYTGTAPFAMILMGVLAQRCKAKPLLVASSALFCLGIFLAGFTKNPVMLYMTYGVMGGFGCSATFSVILKNLIPFFPDKTGMATGLMVAAYGSSAIIFAPIMQSLIEYGGVLFNLRVMGTIFALTMAISINFIRQYPESQKPLDEEEKYPSMLKDKRFPLLFIAYTGFATCGLMLISQGGSMGMAIGAVDTATLVMALSLSNVAGRVFWGPVSDRTGRYAVLISTVALVSINGLVLVFFGKFITVFVICGMVILFSYGGCMGMFPALISDFYGARNSALNYGVICIGYSVGGYIGPIVAADQYAATGSYTPAFCLICIAGGVAAICIAILIRIK